MTPSQTASPAASSTGSSTGDDDVAAILTESARRFFSEACPPALLRRAETDPDPDVGPALWRALDALGLARPNIGLVSNIIACPGGDFCSLANARSLPIAADLLERFERADEWFDIGPLDIKISGCINSCGHHHVGHIGVLGVDKHGEEWFQITIGGHAGNRPGQQAAFGKVIGPSFTSADVAPAIERMLERYIALREHEDETFVEVVERAGIEPFRESAYATSH